MPEYLKIQTKRLVRKENKPGTEVGYTSSCVNCTGERGEDCQLLREMLLLALSENSAGRGRALKQRLWEMGKQERYNSL